MPGNCAASRTGWVSRHDVLPGGNNRSLIVSTVPVRDEITTGSRPVTGDPIVEFIAAEPGLADRLLALHVDDGTGHCRACPIGGQSGYLRWPCQIRILAARARATGGSNR
jgi:hypothetical protein